MKKASIVAGAVIGAIGALGAGYVMGDNRMRRKIYRRGRSMMNKVEDTIGNFTSKY